jgi:hypothetical protein
MNDVPSRFRFVSIPLFMIYQLFDWYRPSSITRSQTATSDPASAKANAILLPMPLLPPVIRATLPSKENLGRPILAPFLRVLIQLVSHEPLGVPSFEETKTPHPCKGIIISRFGYVNREYQPGPH